MLRIRTGARHGLRWGVFGFVAVVLALSSKTTEAAPYADIVMDGNSGNVLHATNPDARRHPASLTKIMTLYLLFEQLEAGRLKLDSQLKVSREAAGQDPTKLGLKPGSTLQVEDAIKGIITRSANDAAVVVAEALADDEEEFAKLMTRKAQALGMSHTVYKNASGLPEDGQVTTARDQAMLGRAIQERFPKYYKYFSTRSFTWHGESIANHNHLLGSVEGVDGIKTGYIGASGFNLVTSVHRGNRYLVAVVMGGESAGSRDARMRELISSKIALAATKRTAPTVGETEVAEAKPAPKPETKTVAKVELKPESKPEPKAERKVTASIVDPKGENTAAKARFAVASAASAPAPFNPTGAQAEPGANAVQRIAAGSTEPIRPVLVKTVTVRSGNQGASAPPLHVLSVPVAETAESKPQAQSPQPAATAVVLPAPAVAEQKPEPRLLPVPKAEARIEPKIEAKPEAQSEAKSEEPKLEPKPEPRSEPRFALASASTTAVRLAPAAAPSAPPQPEPAATASLPVPVARPAVLGLVPTRPATLERAPAPIPPAAKPTVRSGWMIQVGAYQAEEEAKQRLTAVQSKAAKMLSGADPFTESVDKGGTTYYRARFAGLDKDKAEAACKYLKRNDVECVTIKN
jgi:D-alanyl-D-alanine carboxypeptidase